MYDFDDNNTDYFLDQDTAVMKALASTDKGLFDVDETKDEDLEALYER